MLQWTLGCMQLLKLFLSVYTPKSGIAGSYGSSVFSFLKNPSYTVGGNVNWYSHCGEQCADSLKSSNKAAMCACVLSYFSWVRLLTTLFTLACQATLSRIFSRQEYWSGVPCPPLGDFPNPGIEPMSFMSPALAGGSFTASATWEAPKLP